MNRIILAGMLGLLAILRAMVLHRRPAP